MKQFKLYLWALVLSLMTFTSNATPINITMDGSPLTSVVATHQPSNYGDNTVFTWLDNDVNSWNALNNTSMPVPTRKLDGSPFFKMNFDNTYIFNLTIDLNNISYDYFVLHWGGQGGGWTQAYYTDLDYSGTYTFLPPFGGENPYVGGLSFISGYGPRTPCNPRHVPDAGSTILLMGLALGCLGIGSQRVK